MSVFLARFIACSLASTITSWMLVWLASNSLLLGRRNCRHWINLFSTGCIVRPTVDWLTASARAMWYWVGYSLQNINLIRRWWLQLSWAGLPLLVGENRVGNICRKIPTLTAVNRWNLTRIDLWSVAIWFFNPNISSGWRLTKIGNFDSPQEREWIKRGSETEVLAGSPVDNQVHPRPDLTAMGAA